VASAKIGVDATQASGLERLTLEVDDKLVSEIKPGELISKTLTDDLQPTDYLIVRFHASIPPKTTTGGSFPIILQFIVKDQFLAGPGESSWRHR
jgi:hypothetical protein